VGQLGGSGVSSDGKVWEWYVEFEAPRWYSPSVSIEDRS
jgi:hypothetical protein